MRYDAYGRAVPEVGDKLAFKDMVLTDPDALRDPNADPSGLAQLAKERWIHGVCVGVNENNGEVTTVSVQAPDGIVTVLGSDAWKISDL
jgi:hypothetical protein